MIYKTFIYYFGGDVIASSRNHGIFRNPIKHKYIAYPNKIYDLNDLNELFKDIKFEDEFFSNKSSYTSISKNKKILSHRNCSIFKLCCKEFAYSKPTKKHIFNFAKTLNQNNCYEPLENQEIKSIVNSIYKRCRDNTLKSGSKKAQINRAKLVKHRKKQIIKYFLKCRKENKKPIKVQLAKTLGITVQSLNLTYGEFIKLKYKI